jgi:hypothetical protein
MRVSKAVLRLARAYLAKIPPAVSGEGGHAQTLWAARCMAVGFNLGAEAAYDLLGEQWNRACTPPWSAAELWHKCTDANDLDFDKPPGWLLEEGGYKAPAQPISAADLMNQDLGEIKWSVPGLIPEGASILAGPSKSGKSRMSLGLAGAVATGGMALGSVRVESGSVLYLALEDGKRRLQKRLGQMLQTWGGTAPSNLYVEITWPRLGDGGLEGLEDWLEDHRDCRLVIIDTLAKVRDRRQDGDSIYSSDYDAVAKMQTLALAYGVGILIVHHTRKEHREGERDQLESVSGTMGLTGAADAVLVLRRHRYQKVAKLHVTGRDIEEQELSLTWEPKCGHWETSAPPTGVDANLTPDRRAIRETIRKAGHPITIPDAVAALKAAGLEKDYDATAQFLMRMEREGFLVKAGHGKYALPEESNGQGG